MGIITKIGKIGAFLRSQKTIGGSLLAIYAFFCMFAHFSLHGLHAECAQELYLRFSEKYPNETTGFAYYKRTEIRLNNGLMIGALAGLAVAIPIYMIFSAFVYKVDNLAESKCVSTSSVQSRNRKNHLIAKAGISMFMTYMVIFVLFSFLFNPFFLTSLVDLGYAFVYATLCSFIVAVYIHMSRVQEKLDDFPETEEALKWKRLELELSHAGSRQTLNLLTWGGVMIFVAVTYVMLTQGVSGMPREVSATDTFRSSIITGIAWSFAIFLGFFGGIVSQVVLSTIHTEEAIRHHYTKRKENQSTTRTG